MTTFHGPITLSFTLLLLRDTLMITHRARYENLLNQLDAVCRRIEFLEAAIDEGDRKQLQTFRCLQSLCEVIVSIDHFRDLRVNLAKGLCALSNILEDASSPAHRTSQHERYATGDNHTELSSSHIRPSLTSERIIRT
jgi:hypothetical protein